jgi:hypothetical protein
MSLSIQKLLSLRRQEPTQGLPQKTCPEKAIQHGPAFV